MSSPIVHVAPAVIKWARLSSGVRLEEAAKTAHIDPEVLAGWEERNPTPTARQLEDLADRYKRPVAVLLRREPPIDPPLPVDYRRLPRGQGRSLSAESLLALRRARRLQRIYQQLRTSDQPDEARLLDELRQDPEEAARVARIRLGVEVSTQLSWRSTDAALRHWRSALESAGVLVFRFRMPVDELRGFSIRGQPSLVAVTNQDPAPAQSFTLFHEWSHLLLGESGICRPSELARSGRLDDVEVFCNAFAGALLVPMPALESTSTVARLRTRDVEATEAAVAIARAFSVSRFVALRRLLAAKAITQRIYGEVVAKWMNQPTAVRRSRFGPEPAIRTISELGRPFVTTVLRAQQTGNITETDAADYLSMAGKHLERVTELVGI